MGRGGATTFQQDLQNADCILIEGSNMAECHPVGFQWVMEAKARGAKIIHVDPRFTRTSAMADLHVPIRVGTDIAFLGGLVNYVLSHERYFREYVVNYTNAAVLLREDFRDTEDLEGLFSGYDAEQNRYDPKSWQYEGVKDQVPAVGHKELFAESGAGASDHHPGDEDLNDLVRDETLQNPRCVFQYLKKHFARYTPDVVEGICGIPPEKFQAVAEALCDNSGRERTSALCYAVGWTHHSVGVQYIRTASILQLLLGNIGRPGGGILALRGHASIQGSTDIPTLFDLLPGYLPMPHASHAKDLRAYIDGNQSATGLWNEFPKYIVSLMKAWFGSAATVENQFFFQHLPRLTGNHAHMTTVTDMADGKVDGYFVMGENPSVGSMNGALQRKGLRNVKWLVVRDLALIETAEFWRTAPEVASGEVRPEDIDTEVFFFPAAAHTEKDGSFTNTQRLLQWHHAAVPPPGDARSELHFMFHLGRRLKAHYAKSSAERDQGIRALTWDYPTHEAWDEPSADAVLAEINGFHTADHSPLSSFAELKDDGSTAAGCWIYTGVRADGVNQAARRKPGQEQTWVAPDWGWAWPANRRILYNRASADPEGKPWSERKRYVTWDPETARWVGPDVPDFVVDKAPSYRPKRSDRGLAALSGIDPFILQADGKGWLFAPSGILDGPMPSHYEPQESVVENLLYAQQCNPLRQEYRRKDNRYHRAYQDPDYPFLLTTYRLTEHHTAGGMSRWLSWLSELQPEMFCEISPELAALRGILNGGWVTVSTARAAIECRVLVTQRLAPLKLGKRTVMQIGVPYHWGHSGRTRGGSGNDLLSLVGDPNVSIVETKAFTANIVAGRQSAQRRLAVHASGEEDARDPRRDLPVIRNLAPFPMQVPKKED